MSASAKPTRHDSLRMGESLVWMVPGPLYQPDFEHTQNRLSNLGDGVRCASAEDAIVCGDALL